MRWWLLLTAAMVVSFSAGSTARQQPPPPTPIIDPPIVVEPPLVPDPDTPAPPAAAPAPAPAGAPLGIAGQVTFLSYRNPERAAEFYEQVLGLQPAHNLGWVRIYAITPTASIGIVTAPGGSGGTSAAKSVMVSFVVEDVDAWYERVKSRGVRVRAAPADSTRVNVRSFAFNDPEGYSLEIFSWLQARTEP
jgi:predicted enzyme related to lactoylglutathione lyase